MILGRFQISANTRVEKIFWAAKPQQPGQQIVQRVRDFSEEIAEEIEPLGIVATKYDSRSTVHKNTLRQLKSSNKLPPLFETIVPQANQFGAAAEHAGHSTVKQKWGYAGLADQFKSLAREVLNKLET
jgi:chromosome partitioning protein